MANTFDIIRNKMQQIKDTSQNKPIGPQLYKGEALPANVGKLGLMNQIDNISNRNTTSSAGASVVSPYGAKVNEAISSINGNAQPIIAKPVVDEGKIKQDAYNQGVADNKAEYAKNTSGMMTTEQATKMSEDQRAAEAEAIRAKVRAAIAQGTQAQNKIINDAPAQFVDPMNRASFQGAKNSQAIDERMVAMGLGRSGSNITAQTSNNNQTSDNINDLENAKAKVITDAQQAIANLEASGSLQEVQLVQEAAKASLERLQNQINIIDNRKNEQATAIFNNANNALKTSYDIGANEKQLGMQEKTYNLGLLNDQGKTLDTNGNIVDTAATIRQRYIDAQAKSDKEKNDYIASITGLGDKFDYQAKINEYTNDGDPSNDWRISPLMQEQQKKKDIMAQDFLSTIGQYSNDYQAAINSLNPNDPVYDKKLAFLKAAQALKKSTMATNQATAAEAQRKNAMDVFDKTGIATPDIAAILGIPVGTTTREYQKTQYDINKPYYNPNSGTSATEKFDTNRNASFDDVNKHITAYFTSDEVGADGFLTGRKTIDKQGAANYLKNYLDGGGDPRIADSIANTLGINFADFQQPKEQSSMWQSIKDIFN